MQQQFESHQFSDDKGNPAGGSTFGPGFTIAWQNGPLAGDVPPEECIVPEHHQMPVSAPPLSDHPDTVEEVAHDGDLAPTDPCRRVPNGAFVETIIAAAKDRLEFYQQSKFACAENAFAIVGLEDALDALHSRTVNREARQVEGTHEV